MGRFKTSNNARQRILMRQSAQQIPWPEIFKRHIFLIEGHLKMTEMIKKHTVAGSANWETICSLIDQTKEMLRETNTQSRIFIPHVKTREKVPLGSSSPSIHPEYLSNSHEQGSAAEEDSSPSMHPEYLSNSHEQGSAAEEDEQPASPPITQGADQKRAHFDDDPKHKTGAKRTKLGDASSDIAPSEDNSIRGSDSGLDGPLAISPKPTALDGEEQGQEAGSSTTRGANGDAILEHQDPSYIWDVNSVSVNPAETAMKPRKRDSSIDPDHEGREIKKFKRDDVDNEQPASPAEPKVEVEFEDISQEVDARVREKEEKRKRKEKKRKKIVDVDSNITAPDANTTAEGPAKLKKKKKVRHNDDVVTEASKVKKRSGAGDDEGQGERRKKRYKKNRETKDS